MSAEDDIRKTIAQFANSFDLKDWALLESALAGLITVDYSDLRGDLPKEIIGRGYVQARREALEKLDTQHIIGNLETTVDGERASVRASSMIFKALSGVVFNTRATRRFGLPRAQDGDQDRRWVIDGIKQTVLWDEGDPDIPSGVKKERPLRFAGLCSRAFVRGPLNEASYPAQISYVT